MKRSPRHVGNQAPKTHVMQASKENGIIAVRRPIAPVSYALLATIIEQLRSELGGAARTFNANSTGVTVIGFTRFTDRHQVKGPPTTDVCNEVPSANESLQVQLGAVAIYGSSRKHKLGIAIVSSELNEEAQDFEEAFSAQGFPLKKDHNASGDAPNHHCSVALLYEDHVGYIADEATLRRYEQIVHELVGTQTVTLAPVSRI